MKKFATLLIATLLVPVFIACDDGDSRSAQMKELCQLQLDEAVQSLGNDVKLSSSVKSKAKDHCVSSIKATLDSAKDYPKCESLINDNIDCIFNHLDKYDDLYEVCEDILTSTSMCMLENYPTAIDDMSELDFDMEDYLVAHANEGGNWGESTGVEKLCKLESAANGVNTPSESDLATCIDEYESLMNACDGSCNSYCSDYFDCLLQNADDSDSLEEVENACLDEQNLLKQCLTE